MSPTSYHYSTPRYCKYCNRLYCMTFVILSITTHMFCHQRNSTELYFRRNITYYPGMLPYPSLHGIDTHKCHSPFSIFSWMLFIHCMYVKMSLSYHYQLLVLYAFFMLQDKWDYWYSNVCLSYHTKVLLDYSLLGRLLLSPQGLCIYGHNRVHYKLSVVALRLLVTCHQTTKAINIKYPL